MARIDATKDYYRILELTVVASQDAIRAAHRELARQYHPDSGGGDIERFRRVQEAYQVLSQAGTTRVGNVVDPKYTVVSKFPKRLLPRKG